MLKSSFKELDNLDEELYNIFEQLHAIAVEPQKTFPDVLIWMYSGDKGPVGYARIPAEEIMSIGTKDGGLVRTVLLRALKSKKNRYQDMIKAKLEMRLWLGSDTKKYLQNAPAGYEPATPPPFPPFLTYQKPYHYHLRAYMYQGRTVLGSDPSGLSDPFVRLVFGHHVVTTRIINQTRSPVWDEMFDLNDIEMCQSPEELKRNPPVILLNVFDQDDGDVEEFLGQAVGSPHIIGKGDRKKHKPEELQLEWLPITIGEKRYGEVLASFELYCVSINPLLQTLHCSKKFSTLICTLHYTSCVMIINVFS